MIRGHRYKLSPTPAQEEQFRQFAGVCRLVYNLALEQRRDHWRAYLRAHGRHIDYVFQCRELTSLRAQFDWIAAVSSSCQNQALRDLDDAYIDFFRGRNGYPTPRRKGLNDTFRFQGRDVSVRRLNGKWSAVRLPKIGWVKFRDTRPMLGELRNVTISRDALGWHISLCRDIDHDAPANHLPAVGIDRGVANTLTLSTGEHLSLPTSLGTIDRQHRQAQRALARKKRASNRRRKQVARVARLSAKRARIRRDWQHKTALNISCRFGAVVLEDLRIQSMCASASGTLDDPGRRVRQKSGLNRAILNQGWYAFETILAYKLEERGGHLLKVPAAFTSQTCSDCGAIDKQSRESQARFACRHCGSAMHADVNAAINIRDAGLGIQRRNTPVLRVEGSRQAPDEARTVQAGVLSLGNLPVSAGRGC